MTDKERLEEIKSRVWKDKGTYAMGDYSQREGYIYTLSDYDYEWLIEQAERVEKLETQLSINTNNMKQLQKENERYKQALEEIRGLYPLRNVGYQVSEIRKIVIKALEGDDD
jgi:chromosome segregation ATPase